MKTQKPIVAALTASVLALASISVANAAIIGTVASPTHPVGGTFTGGAGGVFNTSSVPVTFDGVNATFTFSPLTATSGYDTTFGVENLSGGSFSVVNGSGTLVSGTFTGSSFSTIPGSQTVTFLSNTVTYTGGSKLAPAGLVPTDTGSFSFSFANSNHTGSSGVKVTGGYIDSFTTDGVGGTFSGTPGSGGGHGPGNPVPEPGSVAVLMIGGMFLLGAALRRRPAASTFAS
ncbi:hypothetical protein CCAX7_18670 [Capsulimonas corticalis]|uniref:Uncharacterized protein n=1 Tax=Capsulimonas corticalis TaxID=2219043 RepID=A0A402D5K2_9BACT|nr:PEP-CTERM sorting domain-containing protein [Capsulimonas corticalis]BDI29816.1 hypothetical protein CCAX7_18670 [Capsulimonas corticalis]